MIDEAQDPDLAVLDVARVVSDPREIAAFIDRLLDATRPKPPREDLKEQRIQIAYRLIRECARLQGWIENDQLLGDTIEDQWDAAPTGPRAIPMRSIQSLEHEVLLPDDPEALAVALRPLPVLMDVSKDHHARDVLLRMPLLPHALPEALVERWTRVQVAISTRVRFDKEDPQALREILGTAVGGVRAAWPTSDEIIAFEDSIVAVTTQEMIEGTRKSTRALLIELGMSLKEAKVFEELARRRAIDLTHADVEEKRALLELRTEDLISRARNTPGEIRTELMGIKALGVIQGVAKADLEDDDQIFARVVSRGAKIRDTTAVVVAPRALEG